LGLRIDRTMRTLLLALCLLLPLAPAHAQSRLYSQPELDALLAPVALYPDALLSQILAAAVYPDQVAQASDWSRRNPGVSGDDAVQLVQAPVPAGVPAALAAARGLRQPREQRLALGLRYASPCLVAPLAQCSGIPALADHPEQPASAVALRGSWSAAASRNGCTF